MNTPQKYILVLNGPMCAGKSTVTKILMQGDAVFRGSYDAIKWLIGGYSADNSEHRKLAKEITFGMITYAVNQGFSVVIDGGFADYRDRYKKLAADNDYVYLSINIEAPYEVLEKRFLERVESAKKVDSKTISVTTVEGFKSRYDWYITTNKDPEGIVLDSNELSLDQILEEIKTMISA